MRCPLLACTLLLTLVAGLAGDARAERGALRQLDGGDGCISKDGSGGECTPGNGLDGALDLAITPDGASVYVASFTGGAVAILARNESATTGPIGKLTQAAGEDGCVAAASGGPCAEGKGLHESFAVAVSQDGESVYVAGSESDAIATFARDRDTGGLRQLAGEDACVSDGGSGGECRDGAVLDRPVGLTVTRDGNQVYATANFSTSLAILARDEGATSFGALTATGCLSTTDPRCTAQPMLNAASGIRTSPDGRHLYVTAQGDSALLAFARNARTGELTPLAGLAACASATGSGGACATARGMGGARGIAMSRDGRNVYVASEFNNTIAIFARDRKSGALQQLPGLDGCVAEGGIPGVCATGKALLSPRGVAVSKDGRHVYATAAGSNAVAVFARDRRTGKLTQLPDTAGCISETGDNGACADGKALKNPGGVVVSDDGKSVYVASLSSGAVAVFAREKR